MRVFVTGATGALGRHLVPGLLAAGHEVTATTRSSAKAAGLRDAGAEPVVLDGLDREAVIAAVRAAAPEVIVHQMTALADMRSLRRVDRVFAATNELRTRGTDNLLAAAERAGARRVVAQGHGFLYEQSGGPVKTEDDPAERRPVPSAARTVEAIRYVDETVRLRAPEGIVLRYGAFYGAGASDPLVEMVRKRQMPVLPYLAEVAGAKPPLRVPAWLGRLLAGEFAVAQMTGARGVSNEKAKKELGWEPRYASWREGFRAWVGG